jgi:hypothetical protein
MALDWFKKDFESKSYSRAWDDMNLEMLRIKREEPERLEDKGKLIVDMGLFAYGRYLGYCLESEEPVEFESIVGFLTILLTHFHWLKHPEYMERLIASSHGRSQPNEDDRAEIRKLDKYIEQEDEEELTPEDGALSAANEAMKNEYRRLRREEPARIQDPKLFRALGRIGADAYREARKELQLDEDEEGALGYPLQATFLIEEFHRYEKRAEMLIKAEEDASGHTLSAEQREEVYNFVFDELM